MKVHWGRAMPHPLFASGGYEARKAFFEMEWRELHVGTRTGKFILGEFYNRIGDESVELYMGGIIIFGSLDAVKRCIQLGILRFKELELWTLPEIRRKLLRYIHPASIEDVDLHFIPHFLYVRSLQFRGLGCRDLKLLLEKKIGMKFDPKNLLR